MDKIKVSIVDDHPVVRSGIQRLIDSDDQIILLSEASNGKDFLEKLNTQLLPDIVITDLNMPFMNGFELLRILKINYPNIRSIVISLLNSLDAIQNSLSLGAFAFLNKEIDLKELDVIIKHVYYEGHYNQNLRLPSIVTEARNLIKKSGFQGKNHLTTREALLCSLLATASSYEEISQKLKLEIKTIQNYRDKIYQKMGFKNRNDLALFAIRNGLFDPYDNSQG